ncbi:MAG: hypothetical protein U0R64_06785 [Candidatus Nanopelagicales bacterium]
MPEVAEVFPRAWIEFPDPADPAQSIRADLTWLTSRWTCIYGQGCRGIDAAMPDAGCCTHGAHFSDHDDEKRVKRWVRKLTADEWELRPRGKVRTRDWVETDEDGDRKTRVVDGACVFQNSPRFAAGAGCALHLLAQRSGESYIDTKPDVCWQLPIRRDYAWVEANDGTQRLVITITEYQRAMWGPGGHDFPWYCSSDTEAHVGTEPVYLSNRDELVAMIGAPAYEELARHCAQHESARAPLAIHPADPV